MNYNSSELNKTDLTYGVYYTVGGDGYWLGNAERIFRSLVEEGSLSLYVFDRLNSLSEAVDALNTYSFSAEPNVVIVKDSDYKLTENDRKTLKNLVCDEGYLLFLNVKFFAEKGKNDKKKNAASLSSDEKKGYNAINCDKLDKFACARYAEKLFSCGIDRNAALLLADYCNCDMARINIEAGKLSDYCGEKKVVSDDVSEIVVEDTDLQIFMFVNSIVDGKNELAKKQLARLRKRGESPALLLSSLISQYRRMLYASMSPLSDKELADLFRVKEYAITKVRENRKLSKKQLKTTLENLVSYEYKFKSGVMSEQTAFDAAITGLIAKENV